MVRLDDILPCPFCGSKKFEFGSWVDERRTPHTRKYYVQCRECFSRGPSVDRERKSAPTIEAWNAALRRDYDYEA
jgi:Lar family restriction alleviation protein